MIFFPKSVFLSTWALLHKAHPPQLPTIFSISETITLNSDVLERKTSLGPQRRNSTFSSQSISLVISRVFWAEFWIQMETSTEAGWVNQCRCGWWKPGVKWAVKVLVEVLSSSSLVLWPWYTKGIAIWNKIGSPGHKDNPCCVVLSRVPDEAPCLLWGKNSLWQVISVELTVMYGEKRHQTLWDVCLSVSALPRGWELPSAVLVVLHLSFCSNPKLYLLILPSLEHPPRCSSSLLQELDQATEQQSGVLGGE